MSFQFNADEILAMAEQIERNGIQFYRKAAEMAEDSRIQKLLLDLAVMEVDHEKIFTQMRVNLTETERQATVFDPEHESSLYLQAMADGHVFKVRQETDSVLTGEETTEEIMQLAIGREKDSIVFYLGLKEMISDRGGRDRIDEIIKEEMQHIALLNKEMATVCRQPS